MPALPAFEFRLVLEKLYGPAAAGTFYFENIIQLPKPLILSWTSWHFKVLSKP
jgi:hypothetical protein